MTIALRRTLFLIVGGLFTLAVVIAAAASSDNQAHATGPTKTVHVKQASLAQTCGDQAIAGAHFVINQIASADQPGSIKVTLADGSTITVGISKSLSSVAHYTVIFAAPSTVTDATAVVPASWTGQFVLSNYICGPSGSSSPPSSTGAPSTGAPSTGGTS